MTASEKFYIGLDVGRTIRAALVRESGQILQRRKVLAEVRDPRALIAQLIETINALKAEAPACTATGIGWPGLINRQSNRLEVTPNMLDVSALDLHQELLEATGLPAVFENDANAGAYGEWCCGAARGYRDVFYITMGTGIGAGLILEGQLQRGCRGFAGEFGHFKIEVDGLECGCGSTGCLETLASGPNIVRRARERLFSDPSFSVSRLARDMEGTLTCERIVHAAMEEDELARSVLRETGIFLGMAVSNIINLLNVEMVVLGGGVMAGGEPMLGIVREETARRTIPLASGCCRIVPAELGQDAGIIGAAMIARDAHAEASRL